MLGRSAQGFEAAVATAAAAVARKGRRGESKRGMAGSPREWMDGRVVSYQGRAGRLVALLPSARAARDGSVVVLAWCYPHRTVEVGWGDRYAVPSPVPHTGRVHCASAMTWESVIKGVRFSEKQRERERERAGKRGRVNTRHDASYLSSASNKVFRNSDTSIRH